MATSGRSTVVVRVHSRATNRLSALVSLFALLPLIEHQQAFAAPQTTQAGLPTMIATGCVSRQPDANGAPAVAHEAGSAIGLALTKATLTTKDGAAVGAVPRSAVPGSLPAGSGSGTTSQPVTGGRTSTPIVDQAFWLAGGRAGELSSLLGKRVEVIGTVDALQASNPGTLATPSADAGQSPARRSPTASTPASAPAVAHPSAPSRAITVNAFRVLSESCG